MVLSFGSFRQQGEFIVTKEGVEGSLIYAASALLRDEIEARGSAVMMLDLAPIDPMNGWSNDYQGRAVHADGKSSRKDGEHQRRKSRTVT